jgi:hypothetical protein
VSDSVVRRLASSDLPALLALQRQVLPDTMSARLGPRFNVLYHQTMLASDDYLCDGCFVDGLLVGYLSYTADTMRLLRGVFRRSLAAYARALLGDLLRRPQTLRLIYRVARSVVAQRAEPGPSVPAELLSVGVLPAFRGRRPGSGNDRSVADMLLGSALNALRARGADAVLLVSKPAHVDPVPHRFVRKYAFASAGPVRRFGIDAEMYVLKLGDSQKDAAVRHA